jgi:hypothetical protein
LPKKSEIVIARSVFRDVAISIFVFFLLNTRLLRFARKDGKNDFFSDLLVDVGLPEAPVQEQVVDDLEAACDEDGRAEERRGGKVDCSDDKVDDLVRSLDTPYFVIPAKAGIQSFQ